MRILNAHEYLAITNLMQVSSPHSHATSPNASSYQTRQASQRQHKALAQNKHKANFIPKK